MASPGELDDTQPVDDRVLKNVVAYVEVRSTNDNRSEAVRRELDKLGATVVKKFTNDVTHVIFKEGSNRTKTKAQKMGVHFVSVLWVESCKQNETRVSERMYPAVVPRQKGPHFVFAAKLKKAKSMQPRDFEEDLANSAERLCRKKKRIDVLSRLCSGETTPYSSPRSPMILAQGTQPRSPDDGYVLTPVRLTIPETPPSMREKMKQLLLAKQGVGSHTETDAGDVSVGNREYDPLQRKLFSSTCGELHSLNAVSWGINNKIKEQMAARGTPVRTGTWLPEEDQYLRENIERYKLANPTVDVHHLLFGEKAKSGKGRIIKSTRFYECMCRGLMRTCYDCYQRVRKVLYANNDVTGVYSDKEQNQLRRLYAQHGPDWKKIGNKLGRRPQSVFDKYNNMQAEADEQAVKRKINYNSDDLTGKESNGQHVSKAEESNGQHVSKAEESNGQHVSKAEESNGQHVSKAEESNGQHVSKAEEGNGQHVSKAEESNGQHVSKSKINNSDNDKLENESNSHPTSKRKRNISRPTINALASKTVDISHVASHPTSKRKRNISRPTINALASKTVDISHVASHPTSKMKRNISRPTINALASKTVDISHVASHPTSKRKRNISRPTINALASKTIDISHVASHPTSKRKRNISRPTINALASKTIDISHVASHPTSKMKRNISRTTINALASKTVDISHVASHPTSKRKRNISRPTINALASKTIDISHVASHPTSKRKRNISRPTINALASTTVDISHVAITNEKTGATTSPSKTCNVQTAVSDSEEEIVSDDSESNSGTRNLSGNNSNSSERTETKHIEKSNTSRTLKTSADSLTTSIKISRIESSTCAELHSLNAVSWGINNKIKEQMAARGTPVRTGTWLPEEDQYLRENIERYKLANPTVDVHHLLFGEKAKSGKGHIIKSTRFYECMCRGLMRTCYDCYQRVRKVLYANNDVTGVYSGKEENQLRRLYAQHGPDWKKIGNELGRRPQSVFDKYNNMQAENHGVWSHQESKKLVSTMELFVKKEGKNAKADLQDNLPWSEISKHVPGRTTAQCRHHWMLTLRKNYLAATDKQKKWKNKDKLFLLEDISVQKVARDADIDFDVIRSHFEKKGQFVSKPSLRRNWLRLKQTVPDHSMKSFPALVDMLLEQYSCI